jgi:hypothetical protein
VTGRASPVASGLCFRPGELAVSARPNPPSASPSTLLDTPGPTYAVLAFVAVYAVITALHALGRRIGVAAFGQDGIASEAPDPADAGSGRRKLAAFLFWMVGLPIVAFAGMGDGGGISNTWAGESLQIDPLFWRLVMVPFGVMCLVSAVLAVARRGFGVVTAVGVAGMAIAVLAGIAGYGGTAVFYFAFFGFLLYPRRAVEGDFPPPSRRRAMNRRSPSTSGGGWRSTVSTPIHFVNRLTAHSIAH